MTIVIVQFSIVVLPALELELELEAELVDTQAVHQPEPSLAVAAEIFEMPATAGIVFAIVIVIAVMEMKTIAAAVVPEEEVVAGTPSAASSALGLSVVPSVLTSAVSLAVSSALEPFPSLPTPYSSTPSLSLALSGPYLLRFSRGERLLILRTPW